MAEAAEYCRYSRKTFWQKVKDFRIPKHGEGNRFYKFDLDEWLRNPQAFMDTTPRPKGKRLLRVTA